MLGVSDSFCPCLYPLGVMAHSTVFTIIDSPCINMTTFFEYSIHILILPYYSRRYSVLLKWGALAKFANKVPTDPQRFACKVTRIVLLCVSGGDTTCTRRTEEELLITSLSIKLLLV